MSGVSLGDAIIGVKGTNGNELVGPDVTPPRPTTPADAAEDAMASIDILSDALGDGRKGACVPDAVNSEGLAVADEEEGDDWDDW